MRPLAAVLVAALAAPLLAADKPEDKAKEAAVAFLKAVKAKDADAIAKQAAAPFLIREGDKPKVLKDADALKAWVKERLAELKDTDKVPTEVAKVFALAEVKEKLDTETAKLVEEAGGKDAWIAVVVADGQRLTILVRFGKDGKAVIAGLAR